jgi:hypothetical protein
MAHNIWKRERHTRLETMRRYRTRLWYLHAGSSRWSLFHRELEDDWAAEDQERRETLAQIKRHLKKSVHGGISTFSGLYFHPLWRKAGKRICAMHLQGEHDRADALDPQPKRLGIMWYVY